MNPAQRQQAFLEVAARLSVMDGSTLTRLLHAVPKPEDAIRYLLEKQLIDQAKADQLETEYRAEITAQPKSETPRPAASAPAAPPRLVEGQSRRAPSATPRPDTSEVDAFDAMIDDILND